MSKGLLNSMVLKNLFEDVDGAELLPALIESGVITKEQVEEYCKENIKSQKAPKPTYSIIEDGVLVEFSIRDLNSRGEYTTPRGVVAIGDEAFAKCHKLLKIHLSRDVVEIGSRAFSDCRNLESVTMTNSVLKIGLRAFDSCFSLTELKLSNNIKDIKDCTFKSCISLEEIILPEKVETIGFYAFGNCENLTAITGKLSKNLLWVHSEAFEGTPIQQDFMRKFKEIQASQKQEKGNIK